jgi:hypothetical protein
MTVVANNTVTRAGLIFRAQSNQNYMRFWFDTVQKLGAIERIINGVAFKATFPKPFQRSRTRVRPTFFMVFVAVAYYRTDAVVTTKVLK